MYTPADQQPVHQQPAESFEGDPQRQALGEKLSGVERLHLQQEQERHELIEERLRKSLEEPLHSSPEQMQLDPVPPALPPRVHNDEAVSLTCCADFQLIPVGGPTPSFPDCMEAIEGVLKKLGVRYEVHEQSTVMHGKMVDLMESVRLCQEAIHSLGCQNVISNVRFSTRSTLTLTEA